MELFYDPGGANVLRDRATGILSDLLSDVIERVRSKTGEDMLGVAEGLNLNRHNTRLHALPLKEGVKDVCAALREHAASRKRKRTKASDSDCSQSSDNEHVGIDNSTYVSSQGIVTGANDDGSVSGSDCATIVSDCATSESDCATIVGDCATIVSDCAVIGGDIQMDFIEDQSGENSSAICEDVISEKQTILKTHRTRTNTKLTTTAPRQQVRVSLRRAKLNNMKLPTIPLKKLAPVSTSPLPSQSQTDNQADKKQDPKPKRKRVRNLKDLHKKCQKYYNTFKLEDMITAVVPFINDDNELSTLIESKCPKKWEVGKPRTPVFKKKYLCRRCVFGESI